MTCAPDEFGSRSLGLYVDVDSRYSGIQPPTALKAALSGFRV